MCGIAGFFDGRGSGGAQGLETTAHAMAQRLKHRGPDDGGVWVDETVQMALAHRRLSIIDLSAAGHQPMVSESGRYVIVYNGESYNFPEIRNEVEKDSVARAWRGHSDTEVILAAMELWGVEKTLKRMNGMFAFAIWDRQERVLTLARDRLGEKPLYYGWWGKVFLFGSELKALRAYPGYSPEIDRNALALYLRYNYVPAPYSIYKGIKKLPPGTFLSLRFPSTQDAMQEPSAYWSALEAFQNGMVNPLRLDDESATDMLDGLMRDAVKTRMVSDVPLGVFLSGGVDSSIVAAMMQAQSPRAVKTFTIGFHEEGFDEAKHAMAVAKSLGTDHTEMYASPEDARAVIPDLPAMYCEPFADSSQIPTFLVSKLARRHVTVALSGDGGDELFGGYNRYFWGRSIWKKVGPVPLPLRRALAMGALSVSPSSWDFLFGLVKGFAPKKLQEKRFGARLYKLAKIISASRPEEMYKLLVSHFNDPANVAIGSTEPLSLPADVQTGLFNGGLAQKMMLADTLSYLPDDILVKVDRASMAVSLEVRAPMLDHRLVEFAARLPLDQKMAGDSGKILLRKTLDRYVPREIIERPKMGFGVPIGAWLRGPLREWAETLLDEGLLAREGFFNPGPVVSRLREHLSGARDWEYDLWGVLMFQAWLEAERG
ncbi:MAG: asparagine synthase (glutamine-hydrolyzing) [Nitrospinae bacterium]|nr:asparagine synthase (glutamine-hydrolyzing) [Nitrospinota bacterium]MBF0633248.1 asparagine synthase (glutamine-hydrolyzing) [Nitrospinota bacterium]